MPDPGSQSKPFPRTLQLVHRLDVGGAELLAARFARRFGGPSQVVVGCLDDDGPLGERLRGEGFNVVALRRRPGALDFRCLRRLRRLVADERIELIHAHQATPFFYALMARGPFTSRPRILFTEHGRFFPDRRNRKRAWLQRRLLGRDDKVVAVGEAVRRALATNEGVPWSRIQVIYNGAGLEPCSGEICTRGAARRELGLEGKTFVVVQIARLDPIKNHRMAFDALRRLRERHSDCILVVVGDGPERAPLEEVAQKLELGDAVRFVGARTDSARFLTAADVAILTSVSEGIPLVLIEAMAANLPVVATSVGGVPEVVVHESTGLLVEVGNDLDLAGALGKLADDAALRERLGSAGRARAEVLFNEEQMFAAYAPHFGGSSS